MKTLPILLSICFLTFKTFAADPLSDIDAHYPFAKIFEGEKLYKNVNNIEELYQKKLGKKLLQKLVQKLLNIPL
jgi:hypothetical protein